MRIAYAVTRTDAVGGATEHVTEMARAMLARGHEAAIFVGGASGQAFDRLTESGAPVHGLRFLRRAVPDELLHSHRLIRVELRAAGAHSQHVRMCPSQVRQDTSLVYAVDECFGRDTIAVDCKDYKLVANRESVLSRLVEAKPRYRRGTFAYMPTEFGAILCEITRRVDGRALADFVRDEISVPLNLPALRYGLAGRDLNSLAFTYWLGKERLMMFDTNIAEDFEEVNNAAESFNSENPAFSMVTDAASLAAFYEFLLNKGVTSAGKQLLSEKTIHQYSKRAVSGWNRSLGTFIAEGRGFTVGTLTPSAFGWWNTGKCFGHGGAFSSLAFGDFKTGLAVAIVTNGNRNIGDFVKRFIPLTHRLRKAWLKENRQ